MIAILTGVYPTFTFNHSKAISYIVIVIVLVLVLYYRQHIRIYKFIHGLTLIQASIYNNPMTSHELMINDTLNYVVTHDRQSRRILKFVEP